MIMHIAHCTLFIEENATQYYFHCVNSIAIIQQKTKSRMRDKQFMVQMQRMIKTDEKLARVATRIFQIEIYLRFLLPNHFAIFEV